MNVKMNRASALLVIMLMAAGGSTPLWAESGKIGYVDVAKIFDAYQKTKDQDKVLQDAGKKKEEQRDTLVYDIRQLKDELALMNGDMKNKKQELLEQKIQALQDFDRNTKKDLGEQRGVVVREIFTDIDAAIKTYGEKNGFEMIFNEKALLYRSNKLDVTEALLADLNKNYKPGSKSGKK